MRHLTKKEISSLTEKELARIERSASRWLDRLSIANAHCVMVGPKIRGNRTVAPVSIRVLVYGKIDDTSNLPKGAACIPSHLTVRLYRKRHRQYVLVTLPTDIVDATGICLTAGTIKRRKVSVGVLVCWKKSGDSAPSRWGLLSVSHAFKNQAIRSTHTVTLPSGQRITGTLISRTSKTDKIDAAVLEVDVADVTAIMSTTSVISKKTPRKWTQLKKDTGARKNGRSHREPNSIRFKCSGFREKRFPVEDRLFDYVLQVDDSSNGFSRGTSGCIWVVAGQAAAIQFAGSGPAVETGFGQSLEKILKRMKSKLAASRLTIEHAF